MHPLATIRNRFFIRWVTVCMLATTMGCVTNRLPIAGRDAPVQNVVRASQYAFTTDFELSADDPLIQDLVGLRDTIGEVLKLPPGREVIRVVIFENQQRYNEFLGINFPDLPLRRAFFVKQNQAELAIFAFRGESLLEDLRHESTHALLHSSLPHVPIWLDEGLACYFEVGPGRDGVHARHVAGLRGRKSESNETLTPSGALVRLESLNNLWEMTAHDYRESWLWVHFCLHHSPQTQQALWDHLAQLRSGRPDSLAARLHLAVPDLDQQVALHLGSLSDWVADQAPITSDENYFQPTHSLWQSSWHATRQFLRPLQLSP